jgi:hypothetical protein
MVVTRSVFASIVFLFLAEPRAQGASFTGTVTAAIWRHQHPLWALIDFDTDSGSYLGGDLHIPATASLVRYASAAPQPVTLTILSGGTTGSLGFFALSHQVRVFLEWETTTPFADPANLTQVYLDTSFDLLWFSFYHWDRNGVMSVRPFDYGGVIFNASERAIPEPSNAFLVFGGLGLLILFRRRMR